MKKHRLLIALASLLLGGEVSRKETVMHTHTSRLVRGGVLLAALVVSLSMFVSSTDHAKAQAGAQIDISGDWIVTQLLGGGSIPLDCAATVTQAGTGLSMAIDCPSYPNEHGTFSGTIDTATGDFSLSGTFLGALDLTGTASSDGNSISGSDRFGTFDGVRQSAATPPVPSAAAVPATGSGPASSDDSTGLLAALAALAAVAGAVMLAAGVALRRRA